MLRLGWYQCEVAEHKDEVAIIWGQCKIRRISVSEDEGEYEDLENNEII